MINFRKGTGLTLLQTDSVGASVSGQTYVAGQYGRLAINSGTYSVYVGASGTPLSDLAGFIVNSSTDGDVIESGKVGIVLLDGNTVVETDQAYQTISDANYPLGTPLYGRTDGTVDTWTTSTQKIIGWVAGTRTLPALQTVNGTQIQGTTTVLGIKLNS